MSGGIGHAAPDCWRWSPWAICRYGWTSSQELVYSVSTPIYLFTSFPLPVEAKYFNLYFLS